MLSADAGDFFELGEGKTGSAARHPIPTQRTAAFSLVADDGSSPARAPRSAGRAT